MGSRAILPEGVSSPILKTGTRFDASNRAASGDGSNLIGGNATAPVPRRSVPQTTRFAMRGQRGGAPSRSASNARNRDV